MEERSVTLPITLILRLQVINNRPGNAFQPPHVVFYKKHLWFQKISTGTMCILPVSINTKKTDSRKLPFPGELELPVLRQKSDLKREALILFFQIKTEMYTRLFLDLDKYDPTWKKR